MFVSCSDYEIIRESRIIKYHIVCKSKLKNKTTSKNTNHIKVGIIPIIAMTCILYMLCTALYVFYAFFYRNDIFWIFWYDLYFSYNLQFFKWFATSVKIYKSYWNVQIISFFLIGGFPTFRYSIAYMEVLLPPKIL